MILTRITTINIYECSQFSKYAGDGCDCSLPPPALFKISTKLNIGLLPISKLVECAKIKFINNYISKRNCNI